MSKRWFSKRAIYLHLATVIFVPGCIVAAWWQATRAMSGNTLSYLYSVEWPIFAILGVYFWWVLIHTDYENVGAKAQLKASKILIEQVQETTPLDISEKMTSSKELEPSSEFGFGFGYEAGPEHELEERSLDELDPELAAYNKRLAALAERGPKTWRKPELQVVRRR